VARPAGKAMKLEAHVILLVPIRLAPPSSDDVRRETALIRDSRRGLAAARPRKLEQQVIPLTGQSAECRDLGGRRRLQVSPPGRADRRVSRASRRVGC